MAPASGTSLFTYEIREKGEDVAIPELPKFYKEFSIPKKSGKLRKICAPSPGLKMAQRKKMKDLYDHFFNKTPKATRDVVHGFVPGRNVVTAAQQHVGFESTTMLDISDFFDTVSRDMIPKYIQEDMYFHDNGYCAQGFVTSPILACIATIGLVTDINKKLLKRFGKGEFAFTMYADDIQISLKKHRYGDVTELVQIVTDSVEEAGFEINAGKTRTKLAKFGWRRILGVNVGDDHFRATRKTMRKIRAARIGGNKSSLGGLVTWSKCSLPNKPKV